MAEIEIDMSGNNEEEPEEVTEEEEYVPPTKEEYAKFQRDLKRANDQAAKYRTQAKAKGEEAPATDVEKIRAELTKEVEDKFKSRYVAEAAKAGFAKLGLKKDAGKLLKLIDLDEIDIDDDGISGLDVQLEELKEEWPELFASDEKSAPRKRDARLSRDAADKTPAANGAVSSDQRLANLLRRG